MRKKSSISRWIILTFTGILFLSLALSAVSSFLEIRSTSENSSDRSMSSCAEMIRSFLSGWDPDTSIVPPGYESVREVQKDLGALCAGFDLDLLYVYAPGPGPNDRDCLMYASRGLGTIPLVRRLYAWQNVAGGLLPEMEQALLRGARGLQKGELTGPNGRDILWLSAIRGDNGEVRAFIAMSRSLHLFRKEIRHRFLMDFAPFLVSLLLGLVLLLVQVNRYIVLPIHQISNSMILFSVDSQSPPAPLSLPPLREIAEIAASYEKMTGDISSYVRNIELLTQERLETSVELEIARRIQTGLVPEKITLRGDGFLMSAMTSPAKTIGGDFYDCFRQPDGSVCVFMGDVSGEGISAALYMAIVRTVMHEKLMAGLSPADTLNQTNRDLCARNPAGFFVTAFVAVMDPRTGRLLYANAGHTFPVLLGETPTLLMPDPGIALGLFDDIQIREETLTLAPGEGILLYTDGITEAANTDRVFFGTERLTEAVRGASCRDRNGTDGATCTLLSVSRAVHDFCYGNEQQDDMAALALLRESPASPAPVSSSDGVPSGPGTF